MQTALDYGDAWQLLVVTVLFLVCVYLSLDLALSDVDAAELVGAVRDERLRALQRAGRTPRGLRDALDPWVT